jgi:hypothetical protein
MNVSKNILEKMDSADHYEKEVHLTMTELADVLVGAGDTVFTVSFHKKPTIENVIEKISQTNVAGFSDKTTVDKLTKSLLDGEKC